jgi:hypothetical protein
VKKGRRTRGGGNERREGKGEERRETRGGERLWNGGFEASHIRNILEISRVVVFA